MENYKKEPLPGRLFREEVMDLLNFTGLEREQGMHIADRVLCYIGMRDHPCLYHEAMVGKISRVVWVNDANITSYQPGDDPFVLEFKYCFLHIPYIELHLDSRQMSLEQAALLIRVIKEKDIVGLLLSLPTQPQHTLTATAGLMGRVVDDRRGYVVRVYY
ncbi:hypothetical protein GA0116948_11071 [Chitinophaga costaii]|uniref:Uncharacterized protein n=1 Tax=Chitinophaga costaii TaxID=1335309 RepID=A0A1C4EX02_9BACT|nr:hypothetical protein [Chitinophaga costaii]PUZ21589.1 hypothetical protein DCM91_16270 [Chitinophaga costaii]SCC48052.1 hypothetical protein GA0116948_11071 [Chitinophaga costaii]